MDERFQRFVSAMGRAYRRRINEGVKAYAKEGQGPKAAWIGRYAEQQFLTKDLPRFTGVKHHERDPLTSVSGTGDPRKLDAASVLLAGTPISLELKKSDYGGYRSDHQKASQVFDFGLGTRGDRYLVRLCGENGVAQLWSHETAAQAVEQVVDGGASEFAVPPPKVIPFAPDVVTPKGKSSAVATVTPPTATKSTSGTASDA